MVFPMFTYSCKSWTVKKAEHQRIVAFKLWSWRRLLRVPWTARRSNQSILREINPEYSLVELMLKLQCYGHLMWTVDSSEKSPMLGKTEGRRRRGHQRMWWLDDITDAMDMNLGKFWETVRARETWHAASWGLQRPPWMGDWTTTKWQTSIVGCKSYLRQFLLCSTEKVEVSGRLAYRNIILYSW